MSRKQVIEYKCSGGILHIQKKVNVYDNGDVLKVERRKSTSQLESHLWKKQLEELLASFDANNFFDLDNYIPAKLPIISDPMSYSITYDNDGRNKTVYVESGAVPPKNLTEIIKRLNLL